MWDEVVTGVKIRVLGIQICTSYALRTLLNLLRAAVETWCQVTQRLNTGGLVLSVRLRVQLCGVISYTRASSGGTISSHCWVIHNFSRY